NDNEVLAAYFGYDALDPDLAGPRTSGFFGNVKADLLGSCKCNEPGPGMLYQGIAGRSASPGEKIDDAMRESCLTQDLQEKCGNSRRVRGRFYDHGIAGDDCRRGHAGQDGAGKIPGWNHRAHAQRDVLELVVLSRNPDQRLRARIAKSFPPVKLAEVYCF